jgi:hypothetical protein
VTQSSAPVRERYEGRIAGVGTTSGIRLVVGNWARTPLGAFADVMVERLDGHRVLLAPSAAVRDVIEATYVFDEVRVEPVSLSESDSDWEISGPSLTLRVGLGRRTRLGWLLRTVPRRLATSTRWAMLIDPMAARVMNGVRTRGAAREGRREWYGATDLRLVTSASGSFDGSPLGTLAPVDPPCRFGFSSTPRTPSVTSVVTTIEHLA